MKNQQSKNELRSKIMRSVKSKNTGIEISVRKLLRSLGYYYRLHLKTLPGTPDIGFKGRKKVILVHGCFWHGHVCDKGKLPKSNIDFWAKKIDRNIQRDKEIRMKLEALGWDVLTVWQCEIRNIETLKIKLKLFLS